MEITDFCEFLLRHAGCGNVTKREKQIKQNVLF